MPIVMANQRVTINGIDIGRAVADVSVHSAIGEVCTVDLRLYVEGIAIKSDGVHLQIGVPTPRPLDAPPPDGRAILVRE